MRTLIIFEPENLDPFGPLTLLRSVSELRYGIYSNLERTMKMFSDAQIQLWVRPILEADHQEKYATIPINQNADKDALYINAAIPAWCYSAAISLLDKQAEGVVLQEGVLIAAKPGKPLKFSTHFHRDLSSLTPFHFELADYPKPTRWIWDYLDLIEPALKNDLPLWQTHNTCLNRVPDHISGLDDRHIYIHNTAEVSKYVHLDASQGSIIIDADCKISPFSSLIGPLYLGKRSTLKPSSFIRQSVVGKVCNLGGEIKGTIIHPYSNKSHAGFLGDSILGSWINLGAGTTISNLKNNYQPIRVSWDGNSYDTERQFLGSIIGDHSKTAIGVRLNTGTYIGPFCNIFQADFPPRTIPSFSWGDGTHELEKAIQTAKRVQQRRNLKLLPAHENLIRSLATDNTNFAHF